MNLSVREYPSLVKYMGSKTKLMQFVLNGINECKYNHTLVDLFSGSASLAGAVGNQISVHSNDIQAYSKVLADTYTTSFVEDGYLSGEAIVEAARLHQNELLKSIDLLPDYSRSFSVSELAELELRQQNLILNDFESDWHFFTKSYSGTWWSATQAAGIDGLRKTADFYKGNSLYPAIISAIMFAMAYSSIGTGHYAQFRDPKTDSNVKDILIYRRKDIFDIFTRKFQQLLTWLPKAPAKLQHVSTQLDYIDCLKSCADGSTVYADPPYCFVHYSRFYHALETLTLYDRPRLQIKGERIVKGRYREDRHQSPFSIASQVPKSFEKMFKLVEEKDMSLVLSYSNTGMISLSDIMDLATSSISKKKLHLVTTDYQHMTLGRQFDRTRDVKECLIIAS